MKRKFILLPITLTALSPMVSLVGCNIGGGDKPEPEPIETIIVDTWNQDFLNGVGGISTNDKKTYELNKEYLFEIRCQKMDYLFETGESDYREFYFASVVNNDYYDRTLHFTDQTNIYVNNKENVLQQDEDIDVDEDGHIDFFFESEKVKNLKDGDVIYIQTSFVVIRNPQPQYFCFSLGS